MASGLGPDDALLLHRDLDAAGDQLNTKSELHALYLMTEVRDTLGKIDWHRVYSVFDCLKVGLSSEDPRFGPRRTRCARAASWQPICDGCKLRSAGSPWRWAGTFTPEQIHGRSLECSSTHHTLKMP